MKPTLTNYGGELHDIGYAGQIVDSNPATIDSKVNNVATSIDFGRFVARSSTDDTCKAPAASTDKIIGVSVRHAIRPADATGDVLYKQYDSVPFVRHGSIYAIAAENAVRGDVAVSIVAGGGTVGSSTTPLGATAAYVGTGNGTITLDATTPVQPNGKAGAYVATAITAAANGGTFRVEAPDGAVLGDVAVGATFSDGVKFVINDGAVDFIVGDKFTITVGAGRVPLDGTAGNIKAVWETTTTAGAVGVLRVTG